MSSIKYARQCGYAFGLMLLGLMSGFVPPRPVSAADPRPQRVVSINLCTDQLLLMLADEDQVASISYLAREPESSFVAPKAMGYPVNHGRLEELLSLQPDLVLASSYSDRRLLSTLQHLGLRVERMTMGHNAEGIAGNLRQLASLLGQAPRGEALVEEMKGRLGAEVDLSTLAGPKAVFYQPRGYTSGSGTLQDEALRLAGWRNPAAEQGLSGYLPVNLEQVLLWQPDLIITSPFSSSGDSRAEQQLDHPALVRLLADRPLEEIPYKYWICPGPMLAEAVELLRQLRREITGRSAAIAPATRDKAMPSNTKQRDDKE